jgi:predicted deacetylase
LSDAAEDALQELGVKYTTRLGSVLDLQNGTTHHSQSLVWSVRSGWRRQMSLAWNALLFRRLAARGLMRISIHPVDVEHATIWKQIRVLMSRALADRKPLTYDAWLGKNKPENLKPKT